MKFAQSTLETLNLRVLRFSAAGVGQGEFRSQRVALVCNSAFGTVAPQCRSLAQKKWFLKFQAQI